ncbi:MAG: GntR family transcriptional regulator [Actinoplanes sp.]
MEPIARSLLRDTAYDRLRAAIVGGDLAPGAALRADDLARELGLSKAPIRDAITRLSAEGLVETKPQSYTRVTPLVEREVEDAAVVVRAMHDLAVRAVAGGLSESQLERMRVAGERFSAAVRDGDLDAALAADDELHAVPVHAYGNTAAALTIERFAPLIRRAERLLWASPHGERSIQQHDDLITALATGDQLRAIEINFAIWGRLRHPGEGETDVPG